MKPISNALRDQIIILLDLGRTTHQIAAETGVSTGKISDVRKKFRAELPKARGGRPKKLTEHDIRRSVRLVTSGEVDTAVQAAKILRDTAGVDACTQTVRRGLKVVGLKAGTKSKKPALKPHHRRARLQWAAPRRHYTPDDWKRHWWSDETKINRIGSDGRKWVWKHKGEGLTERTVDETLKFGGGSLMIWGCMNYDGVAAMCKIEGNMDADLYTSILEEELLPAIRKSKKKVGDIVFQQDNDPKHTSKKAKAWFEKRKIRVSPWPAQSPDLNPIEHLWNHIKRELAKYQTPPKSIAELWERVKVEWHAIPPLVCQNLINSMNRRVLAVIAAKGGHTKY